MSLPPRQKPLLGLRFGLLGPGRVGTSLARWAIDSGARLAAVAGRPGSAGGPLAADRLGAPWVPSSELSLYPADFLLIAVPDPVLAETAVLLARHPPCPVAIHVAGAEDHSILAPLERVGVATGSLHPLLAFPRPLDRPPGSSLWFAVDGRAPALEIALRLVEAWGGKALRISGPERRIYHLAASLVAGGVTTLLAVAADLTDRCGLPEDVLSGYLDLARGTLDRIAEAPRPAAALTGPAARGDQRALELQAEALSTIAPEHAALVRELHRASAQLALGEAVSADHRNALVGLLKEHFETTRVEAPDPPRSP